MTIGRLSRALVGSREPLSGVAIQHYFERTWLAAVLVPEKRPPSGGRGFKHLATRFKDASSSPASPRRRTPRQSNSQASTPPPANCCGPREPCGRSSLLCRNQPLGRVPSPA